MKEEIDALLELLHKIHLLREVSRWERAARRLLRDNPVEARKAIERAEKLRSEV